jgi:hypothetical protein
MGDNEITLVDQAPFTQTELDLLREIRDEMRSRLSRIEADISLIVFEQRRLGSVVGELVSRPTPCTSAELNEDL